MEAMEGDLPVAEMEESVEDVSEDKFKERESVEGRSRSTSPRLSTLTTTY